MWGLWIACFASGIAGLSYELVYVRYLGHLFGTATPAIAATVAVFFAGTALGATAFARWLGARRRPLRTYAAIEAAIGALGLALPATFGVVDSMLAGLAGLDGGGGGDLATLLLASAALLLPPTALLGATFPAMVAAADGRSGDPTTITARLYGLNTLGAVLGCLAVSLWWLPSLGLRRTTVVLGALNLLIAVGMLVLDRWRQSDAPQPATAPPPDDDPATKDRDRPKLGPGRALALAALTGFAAIAIEVQWVRALALSFPATVYVFALVLCAYLVGIGLGSLLVDQLGRRRATTPPMLVAAYVLAGLGAWLALNILPLLGPWSLERLAGGEIASFAGYLAWVGGSSMLCMLPATLAMGAALPLLVGLATGPGKNAATTAGRLYGVNTLGGVLGSVLGTFVLMPALGLSRSLAALALVYLVAAVAVESSAALRSARRGLVALVGLGAVVVALDLSPEVNALRELPDAERRYYRDTPSGTIAIYDHADGVRSLRINNQYTLSNTDPATVAMQIRLGAIPAALHPAPDRALLIGFATGTTLVGLAADPRVAHVDCVEIHDELFALADFFGPVNVGVHRSPKVRLIEGDGRRYVARSTEAYDLIVEDLFVPRNPGVGSLYSREHFGAARQRLREGGLLVVWLPLWQLGPQELDTIIATFVEAFPAGEGWMPPHGPGRPILGLVGPRDDRPLPMHTVSAHVPPLLTDGALRVERVLDAGQLGTLSAGAPINTLDHPRVELQAPRSMMRAKLRGEPLVEQTMQHLGLR